MELKTFFEEHDRVAIAFSGGVDSAYLLYAAKQYAKEVRAYCVKAEFQPEFELRDALRLAKEIGVFAEEAEGKALCQEIAAGEGGVSLQKTASLKILELQVLSNEKVRKNPADRCYYCKQEIFLAIREAAAKDGFDILLDGTNASDDAGDRPGMKALQELQVLSPLRECGLTKDEIRRLSKEAGLFTWNKPAYACLATRIPAGEEITLEKLERVEEAEGYLFALGFTDFRVRTRQGHARLQVRRDQLGRVLERREEILAELKKYFETVSLDLEVRG